MPKIAEARILIMATDGFEESELFGPRERLMKLGAAVRIASPTLKPIQATIRDDPGRTIRPDLAIADAKAADFDALLLPGGVINPDSLRADERAVALVRAFVEAGKPVAAICHGPWLLVEADALRGRRATGWRSIRTDLRNAGAKLEEARVVRDGPIITAQAPEDESEFVDSIVEAIETA